MAATLLLGSFTAVVGLVVARGQAPPCNCFGAVASAPVGRSTVVRNALLTALGLVALVATRGRAPGSLAPLVGAGEGADLVVLLLFLAGVLFVATAITVRTLRQEQHELHESMTVLERLLEEQVAHQPPSAPAAIPDTGLPVGALVPFAVEGGSTDHGVATLLARGVPLVLVYVSDACGPCRALAPKLQDWATRYADLVSFAVITSTRGAAKYGADVAVLRQSGTELSDAVGLKWTPGAVAVGADGRVAGPVAYGEDRIEQVVTTLLLGLNKPQPTM